MLRTPPAPCRARRGFTLVEVLIVVVILGILAATVLPQFTSASEDAKESALKQNLQQIRGQVDLYRFQHNGNLPDGSSETTFLKAMLLTSEADGTVGDGGTLTAGNVASNPGTGDFGPYLLGQFPPNPYNGKNSVAVGTSIAKDGATGWSYNKDTGEFRPNLPDSVLATDGVTSVNLF